MTRRSPQRGKAACLIMNVRGFMESDATRAELEKATMKVWTNKVHPSRWDCYTVEDGERDVPSGAARTPAVLIVCDSTAARDNLLRLLPLLAARDAALATAQAAWRCFHCDEVFTGRSAAADHFGPDQDGPPTCRLTTDEIASLRSLERDNGDLRRENERLDNFERLWTEERADRIRRIGNCEWWQALDSKEGERLVQTERAEAAEARLTAVRALCEIRVSNDDAGAYELAFREVLALLDAAPVGEKD